MTANILAPEAVSARFLRPLPMPADILPPMLAQVLRVATAWTPAHHHARKLEVVNLLVAIQVCLFNDGVHLSGVQLLAEVMHDDLPKELPFNSRIHGGVTC